MTSFPSSSDLVACLDFTDLRPSLDREKGPFLAAENQPRRTSVSFGWWSDDTVADLFERAAAVDPSRTAVIDPANRAALGLGVPRRLTYAELESADTAMAAQFVRLGLRIGDVVLAQLPNTWECVGLYLAAARLGVVLSPVAMQYRRHELDQILALLEPRAIVTCRTFKDYDHAALGAELARDCGARLLVTGGAATDDALVLATGPATGADAAAVAAVDAPSADDVWSCDGRSWRR